jgi:hypothetical protein
MDKNERVQSDINDPRNVCVKAGCRKEGRGRYDGYGIYVGRLCDKHAAQDSRMEFGRTRMFDPDFAGERLDEDY